MTIAQVKTAWENAVYTNSTITEYTTNLYSYDLSNTILISNAHEAKVYLNGDICFAQFIYNGRKRKEMTTDDHTNYDVTVSFYKECDLDGSNFNDVINFFESLYGVVNSSLGGTWTNTVDFWNVSENAPEIESIDLNGVAVWVGTQSFQANYI